jgi:hypothetical protein
MFNTLANVTGHMSSTAIISRRGEPAEPGQVNGEPQLGISQLE